MQGLVESSKSNATDCGVCRYFYTCIGFKLNRRKRGDKRLSGEWNDQNIEHTPVYRAGIALYITLSMMRTGFRSGYWVVEWADEFDPNLADLLPRFPEMVRGHRIAIASCDSGPFEPTQAEYAKGWVKRNEVAVSPIIVETSELPTPGFDEWYVYAGEAPEAHHRSFVNRWGFAPLDELNPESQDFWGQVEKLQPLHVVGAGTPTMFFATQDEAIFRKVSSV